MQTTQAITPSFIPIDIVLFAILILLSSDNSSDRKFSGIQRGNKETQIVERIQKTA